MEDQPLKDRRIKDATAARTMWDKFRKASISRRGKWAAVQNQLDGAPPLSNLDLVKLGQGWRCNINFRDASSTLDQVMVSYWRLLHDTTNLIAITIHGDDPQSDRNEQIFQDNFNRFVDDWGADYVRNYLLFSQNHVAFGVGLVMWNDKNDPRWEVVRLGEVEVPNKAKASIEKISVMCVRQEMEIEELWKMIRTPELRAGATRIGWDAAALEEMLTRSIKSIDSDRTVSADDVLEVQRDLRNNSLGLTTGHEPIKLVHVFVKDYDEKITRYIFAEKDSHGDKFLFDDSEASGRPDCLNEAVAAIFFDAGNGDFWGAKGFGVKNFALASTTNKLKCRAVDRTIIDGLNFIDKGDGARETVPVTVNGPFNFFPKDVEQIPHYPTGRSILETIGMLESQSSNNNARYKDQSRPVQAANTATEVNAIMSIQSQVDVANATLFLKQIALSIFSEQFRRLRARGNTNSDAKTFKKRCIDDGMDEKAFHEAEVTIRTGADPGAAALTLQAEYAMAVGSLPDADRRWWQEKLVSARFGAQAVKKALRPAEATSDVMSTRLALMENSDMGEGNPLPVDPSDNHVAHVPAHLQPLLVMVDRYDTNGQIDPNALIALQNVIPHLEAHFEYLKKDKLHADVFQQLWPEFTKVKSTADGIFRQVEKMHNQAQQPGFQPPGQPGGPTPGGFSPAASVGAGAAQGPGGYAA